MDVVGFFTYKVRIMDVDSCVETHPTGVVSADSYAVAASLIEHFYGPELLAIEHLYALEPMTVLELNDEVIDNIEHDRYLTGEV